MKRFKAVFATMLAVLSLVSFNSCSDDDDAPSTPAAKNVEGVYKGDMTCSVMGSESVFEDMTFTVSATDDATVSIKISQFGEPPMQVPEITVPGVKVSGSDGTYKLATTEVSSELSNGKSYTIILDGDFATKQLTIRFSLQYGAMPMPMICSFTAPQN